MSAKPFFSVIIPTLNEAKYLPLLLKDLSCQTYRDFEVIVVDGYSEDTTCARAQQLAAKLPQLHVMQTTTRNVSFQRNLGSKQAQADWLIFMDADNRLPPYFLQGIKFRVEEKNPDILSTYIEADQNNRKDKAIAQLVNYVTDIQRHTPNPYCLESMLVFKQQVFRHLHGFNTAIPWGEGSDLLRQAHRQKLKFVFCKNPTYTYSLRRLHAQGTLNVVRNFAQIELHRLLGNPLPQTKAARLYPMNGGIFFEQIKKPHNSFEQLMGKLHQLPSLPKNIFAPIINKPAVTQKFKSLIRILDR